MKDFGFIRDINSENSKSYFTWRNMASRCYNKNSHNYINYGENGVTVCDEWKIYSVFKQWFDDNYIEGYSLDKDVLCEHLNISPKIYSPYTCMFVDKSENSKVAQKGKPKSEQFKLKVKKKLSVSVWFYHDRATVRKNFLRTCKRNDWNMEDFYETFSGEKCNKDKKYFYTPIICIYKD